ncbi:MAG TPA: PAS domain S-box protein, partial [Longimicrobium sp.]|nr:PAS domain S-box protein [Longimicrobium sp.]
MVPPPPSAPPLLNAQLARLVEQHFGSPEAVPPALHEFLAAVDHALQRAEDDRVLLGRNGNGGGRELLERFRRLESDLREHDRVEAALRESDRQLRELADHIAAATFVYRGTRYLYVNAAATELTGYTPDELLRMNFWEVVHPGDQEVVRERGMARQRGADVPERYEFRVVRKDGEVRWVELTAVRITYAGEPAELGTAFDITARKRAEEALQRQALTFANLYDALIISDADGKITDWNAAAERIYGFTRDEVLGRTAVDLWLHPDEAADLDRRIVEALETEGRWQGEVRFVRKDGSRGVSETLVIPLRDAHGRWMGALGVNRDVTERKRAEEALRTSEERIRLMLTGTQQLFFYVHDLDGMYEYLSPSLGQVLGYEPEELVGQRYEILHDPTTDGPDVDRETAVTLAQVGA